MSNLDIYIKKLSQQIENQLNLLVPQNEGPYSQLFEAARYSLLGGGKRLRPIMTLATLEILSKEIQPGLIPACAIEMVHAYSLIHDDLPSMDNDEFRRGKPTLHRAFSEGQAILAGDFLLTHAFEVLSTSPHLSNKQKIQLISILAKHAGGHGMIAGQAMDLNNEGRSITLEELTYIHHKKTAALISAAVEFGGVIAETSSNNMKHLKVFGEKIGLAFQIIDDILDVTSSQEKHGRMIATDQINQKTTYVSLLGIESSKAHAETLYKSAIEQLNQLSQDPSLLINIADLMVSRSK